VSPEIVSGTVSGDMIVISKSSIGKRSGREHHAGAAPKRQQENQSGSCFPRFTSVRRRVFRGLFEREGASPNGLINKPQRKDAI
jgi:hypothetical protein